MIFNYCKAIDLLLIIAMIALIASIACGVTNFFYIGLLWSAVLGMAMGSYATSFVARMPKSLMAQRKDPYCMKCNNWLEPRDLYPIFSFIINAGKCRFCNSPIPKILFYCESAVALNYVVTYIFCDFSSSYALITSFFSCLIIMSCLWFNDRFFSRLLAFVAIMISLVFLIFYI